MDREQVIEITKRRFLGPRLTPRADRLTLLLGITGSGKRTLVRTYQPRLRYFDVSRAPDRNLLQEMPTAAWDARVGAAAIDNLHTAPQLQARILRLFEQHALPPTVLIMAARPAAGDPILQLAARLDVHELWPLAAAELAVGDELRPPLLHRLLTKAGDADALLQLESYLLPPGKMALGQAALDHLLRWGGLPGMLQLPEESRPAWLAAYESDFPARNAGSTGRLKPLPFRRFRRACAAHAAAPLSQTQLTREAHVNVRTGRRYLNHLERLHQIFLLEAWDTELTGTPVKSPELNMLDLGLWQTLVDAPPSPELLQRALLIGEVTKWISLQRLPVPVRTYRTHTGLSVDLLLENDDGILGIHLVPRSGLQPADCRALTDVGRALGRRWRGGILAYQGQTLEKAAPGIWAVPLARLLALPSVAAT